MEGISLTLTGDGNLVYKDWVISVVVGWGEFQGWQAEHQYEDKKFQKESIKDVMLNVLMYEANDK